MKENEGRGLGKEELRIIERSCEKEEGIEGGR